MAKSEEKGGLGKQGYDCESCGRGLRGGGRMTGAFPFSVQ